MSPAPDATVTLSDLASPGGTPSMARKFLIGPTQGGPIDEAKVVTSLGAYREVFGAAESNTYMDKWVSSAFNSGVQEIVVSRAVGDAPTQAQVELDGAASADSIIFRALEYGDVGERISVDVDVETTNFILKVYFDGKLKETSPALADIAAAIAWSAGSRYGRVLQNNAGTVDPVATGTPVALTGGADDRASIDETNIVAAYNRFDELGFGEVYVPDYQDADILVALTVAAAADNRFVGGDLTDSADEDDLINEVGDLAFDDPDTRRRLFFFGPRQRVRYEGALVEVPMSALIAGQIARGDELYGPGQPAAGEFVIPEGVVELTQQYDKAARDKLADAGINVVRVKNGKILVYDWITFADQVNDEDWTMLSAARTMMYVSGAAQLVLDAHHFGKVDKGFRLSAVRGDLIKLACQPFLDNGDLYGNTPDEAYKVDVGPALNPPADIQRGRLKAQIKAVPSSFGRFLEVTVYKSTITQGV